MMGIDWTPDEPVPITPTRNPVNSTPPWGHNPVCYHSPLKLFNPGRLGVRGVERLPVDMTQKRAVAALPLSVLTVHVFVMLLNNASLTRVLNSTSRLRSKRSATWLMYRRISGCV